MPPTMPAETLPAAFLFLPFALPVCAWVAWSDLTRMKIPNRAVAALVLVYLLTGPFVLPLDAYALRWLHLALVLGIGFGLTVAGLIGAGDAKFLAAMATFIDARDVTLALTLTAAALVLSVTAHRAARSSARVRAHVPHWESWERREFPMGVPLASALALYLVLLVS